MNGQELSTALSVCHAGNPRANDIGLNRPKCRQPQTIPSIFAKIASIIFLASAVTISATSTVAGLESAARSQTQLITSASKQANDASAVRAAELEMSKRVQNLGYQLFIDAKRVGLQVENPRKHLDQVNRERRSAGIWDLNVASTRESGTFLLLNELDAAMREPAFALVGYGLVRVEAQLYDDEAGSLGRLSPDCQVKLTIDTEELRYSCQSFLSTGAESNILKDLKSRLSASLEQRAKLRRGS
jgi:hypothetical protein